MLKIKTTHSEFICQIWNWWRHAKCRFSPTGSVFRICFRNICMRWPRDYLYITEKENIHTVNLIVHFTFPTVYKYVLKVMYQMFIDSEKSHETVERKVCCVDPTFSLITTIWAVMKIYLCYWEVSNVFVRNTYGWTTFARRHHQMR